MLKVKMPHYYTVVPDWAALNPGISLWNSMIFQASDMRRE
jgi:hypothetical protein